MYFSSSPHYFLYDLGQLYVLILLGRAILSWFPPSYNSPLNPVRRFLFVATEPVLAPFRKIVPAVGGIDLSFIVAFIVIEIVVDQILARL
jgi:YggT family protein